MISNKSLLAIILARGGSKRLPNKNILPLAGKPLIAWTIEAAKQSKYIDRVIVSTDSKSIAAIAKNHGAEIPFMRPKALASDKATSADAMLHTLRWIRENECELYDYFVLLQPTSPLRTSKHIDEACRFITKYPSAYSVISVGKFEKDLRYMYKKTDDVLRPYSKNKKLTSSLYYPNGAIYITKTKQFLQRKSVFEGKIISYLMNEQSSIDIDYELDLKLAEILLKQRG